MHIIVSTIWFLAGSAVGLLLVELSATLFYCLPKATVKVVKRVHRAGLFLLFLRAALHRCIALAFLYLCISMWGFSHDRAIAAGLSLVLAAYTVHTFTKQGRAGLSASFNRQASRYSVPAQT